jgi:hypothetical protein
VRGRLYLIFVHFVVKTWHARKLIRIDANRLRSAFDGDTMPFAAGKIIAENGVLRFQAGRSDERNGQQNAGVKENLHRFFWLLLLICYDYFTANPT